MTVSDVFTTAGEWEHHKKYLVSMTPWHEREAKPDRYPCLCVSTLEYSHEYGKYKLIFEFVYADQFGAPQAKAACQAVLNSMSFRDGAWVAGPWADPDTPEGEGGVVQMLRDAVE